MDSSHAGEEGQGRGGPSSGQVGVHSSKILVAIDILRKRLHSRSVHVNAVDEEVLRRNGIGGEVAVGRQDAQGRQLVGGSAKAGSVVAIWEVRFGLSENIPLEMHKTDSQLSVIWTAIVDWTVERYFTPARSIDRQELKMTDERRPSSVRQRWIIDHQYTVVLEQRLAVMFIVDTCIQVCSRVE